MSNVSPFVTLLTICAVALLSTGSVGAKAEVRAAESTTVSSIDDSDVTDALYLEFLRHGALSGDTIDVETIDGVVTLSGSVQHALGRHIALDLARHTRGVRAVVDRVEVEAPVVRDDILAGNVTTSLLADPRIELESIEVAAVSGRVDVRGNVPSNAMRELVLDVARGVRGVVRVVDELALLEAPVRSPADVEAEIEARLADDVALGGDRITVEVAPTMTVHLEGVVNGLAARERAVERSWVRGVRAVRSKALTVEPRSDDTLRASIPRRGDEAIRRAVEDALRQDPRVGPLRPRVEVDESAITLHGDLLSLEARDAALSDARQVVGGGLVIDSTTVASRTLVDAETLRDEVRNSLARDPWLSDDTVEVSAADQRVDLFGAVDSRFERAWAERVVGRVPGIADVANHLRVPEAAPVEKSDELLADDVREQWLWSTDVLSDGDLEVEVNGGVAVLKGRARSAAERLAAEREALQTDVVDVINAIDVAVGDDSPPVLEVQDD